MADRAEWISTRTTNTYKPEWYWDLVYQFKTKRESMQISQLELDHIMGNADGLVGKWECGIRSPGAFNLTSWAMALKCNIKLEDNIEETLQI
jgi:transcriptional regulator with XRE-family HTH domain|tara:strand:- start:125 stop:400 length:276 start_codon:yes stop_codon:yes gene_type:complete